MRLEEIQHFLADAVRGDTPLTERDDLKARIEAIVGGNDRLSPQQQAEIYREQFWWRHRDVLYDDYPSLAWYLGEAPFEIFVRAYLEAHPPDSFTLRDLGNHIARFAESYPFTPDTVGIARDLARLEHAFIDVFDGPDREPASVDAVAAIPPEAWPGARVSFHPLLTLLALDHPVQAIRLAVKRDNFAEEGEPSRDVAPAPTMVAIWRGPQLKVMFRSLQPSEAALIEALRAGASLGDAIEQVAADLDEDALSAMTRDLKGWFEGWAKRGWIVQVEQ